MTYVDGFVAAVPTANHEKYRIPRKRPWILGHRARRATKE
jgi:uncharacterized protein YbaA (DUF1428 family)